MQIIVKFFGSFRDLMEKSWMVEEVSRNISVSEFMHKIGKKQKIDLHKKLLSPEGIFRSNVIVLVNGTNIVHLDYLNTKLNDKDVVALFSVVGGG